MANTESKGQFYEFDDNGMRTNAELIDSTPMANLLPGGGRRWRSYTHTPTELPSKNVLMPIEVQRLGTPTYTSYRLRPGTTIGDQ